MFNFLRFLRKRFRDAAPKTVLSAEDAMKIARDAASDKSMFDQLFMTTILQRDDRIIWCVSTPTMGLQLQVLIDDATQKVLEVKYVGQRNPVNREL